MSSLLDEVLIRDHPETSRRVKALWSLLIGIIFASEVAWILFLVYLPIALVR